MADQYVDSGVSTDTILAKLLDRRERTGGNDTEDAIDRILEQAVDLQQPVLAEPEGEPAIQLEDENLVEASRMLFDELRAIIGDRGLLDRKIKLWRDLYDLEPGPSPYPGAPNFTTPLIRSKVAGFTANIRSALDKRPFFVAEPKTAEGQRSKPAWEATMEREVELADARRQIFMAVNESAEVGTGVLKLGVADASGMFVVQPKCIRLEDWYISPPSVETVKQASTFERFSEPLHVFMRKVEKGVYDREAAEKVVGQTATRQPTSRREEQHHSGVLAGDLTSDNTPIALWEAYYRWGGVMYRVILSLDDECVLRWCESPFRGVEAIGDSPPYVAFRPIPKTNYFYGDSYAMILAGIQGMNDWAMNSLLAYNQAAITPGVIVDEESVIETRESRTPTIYPGAKTKVRGNPNEVISYYNPPPAINAERMLQMAQTLGNDATFYDYQLNGEPLGTVRTATEHAILRNASQVKLAEALKNIEYDLCDYAEMKWGLIDAYKVAPEGVYQVYQGQSDQYLIASDEVSAEELEHAFIEFSVITGLIPPEAGELALSQPELLDQLGIPGIDIFIAGARRGDLTWRPQGGETIADTVARREKFERLVGFMGVFEAATQIRFAWYIAKGYLESLEIQNWRDYIPAEAPDDANIDLSQRTQILMAVAEQVKSMRLGGGSGF